MVVENRSCIMPNRIIIIALICFIVCIASFAPSMAENKIDVVANPSSPAKDSSMSIRCVVTLTAPSTLLTLHWKYGNVLSNASLIATWDYLAGIIYGDNYSGDTHPINADDITNGIAVFTINSVQLTDDGTHWCEAVTSRSGTLSSSVAVDVTVKVSNVQLSDSTGDLSKGQTVEYLEETDIDFLCVSRGSKPGADINWSVAGVAPVPPPPTTVDTNVDDDRLYDSIGQYSHQVIWDSHGDTLQCTALNTASPTGLSTNIILDIQVPPKTNTVLLYDSNSYNNNPSGAVREGITHTFHCDITDTRPEADIAWMKGANPIQGTKRAVKNGDLTNTFGTITLTPGRSDHKFILQCETKIIFPGTSPLIKQLTLDVYGPPDTPVYSGDADLTEGTQSDNLACNAANSYASGGSMVWYMDDVEYQSGGESISNGNRYDIVDTLSFTPTRNQNKNVVRCEARHETLTGPTYPEAETTINVKFCSSNVSIIQCPSVTIGEEMTLNCVSSSSNPVTTLQWYEGEELMTNTHEPVSTGAEYHGMDTTLQFTTRTINRQDYQRVNFRCHAVNPTAGCEEKSSVPCYLNVQYPPENVQIIKSRNGPVVEGTSISLNCTAEGNPQPDSFTWFQDDSQIGDGTQTLKFERISRENAGWYRCNAINGINPDGESQLSSVAVQYAANITRDSDMIGVDPKDSVKLDCTADGLPDPTFTWYNPVNDTITNATNRMSIIQNIIKKDGVHGTVIVSSLMIDNVKEIDYGTYRCDAVNTIGDADSYSIYINGTTVPESVNGLTISSRSLNSLNVSWVPGYSGGESLTQHHIVDYRKYTDDQPGPWSIEAEVPDTHTYFVTSGLLEGTSYDIRVFSANKNGRNENGQVVKGTTANIPYAPTSIMISAASSETLTIKWVPGKPDNEPQWFFVDSREVTGGEFTGEGTMVSNGQTDFEVTGLMPNREYEITVYSENKYGRNTDGISVRGKTVPYDDEMGPSPNIALIAGSVAGTVLVVIIVILAIYLIRGGSPLSKQKDDGNIPLKRSTNGLGGVTSTSINAVDETAGAPTYAAVDKNKKKNAPAPTYAAVDKKKKKNAPDGTKAEETAYDNVNFREGDDIYDDVVNVTTTATNPEDDGKTVNQDGLIYQVVGHFKSHPKDAPPIQTEAPTEYAALDFNRIKPGTK